MNASALPRAGAWFSAPDDRLREICRVRRKISEERPREPSLAERDEQALREMRAMLEEAYPLPKPTWREKLTRWITLGIVGAIPIGGLFWFQYIYLPSRPGVISSGYRSFVAEELEDWGYHGNQPVDHDALLDASRDCATFFDGRWRWINPATGRWEPLPGCRPAAPWSEWRSFFTPPPAC